MTISWTPIKERFAAEVDIDLNSDLTPEITTELAQLFDERGMLVFRKQDIDYATQQKVVSIVGNPLTEVKYVSSKHNPAGDPLAEPSDPDSRTVMFHSDYVFLPELPLHGISLYGEEVEASTTDRPVQGTKFLSARNGYLDLPDSARKELDGARARHVHALNLTTDKQLALKDLPYDQIKDQVTFTSEHPLFMSHPRTGKPVLVYIPWFTHSIVGLSSEESKKWFALFDELLYKDENIHTHRWEQGDLVIWDNLAMQHCKEVVDAPKGQIPTRVLRRSAFGPAEPNIYKHSAFESDLASR